MKKYSFALSDKLCREYMLFKRHSTVYDKKLVSKLLRYHTEEEFITNNDQLSRVGIEVSEKLSIALTKAGFGKKTIEELSSKTLYKLILCDDKSTYPYVNICDDHIATCVVGCYYQAESRAKAIAHLKDLCSSAKSSITIYDNYLKDDILSTILANRVLTVKYIAGQLDSTQLVSLQSALPLCSFESIRGSDAKHHDRYIIIDDKFEIIITSGFEFIQDNRKELTYIVRPIKQSRF